MMHTDDLIKYFTNHYFKMPHQKSNIAIMLKGTVSRNWIVGFKFKSPYSEAL